MTVIKKRKGGNRLGELPSMDNAPQNLVEPEIAPIDDSRKRTVTFSLSEKTIELIRKESFNGKITKSQLIEKAISKLVK